MSSKYDQYWASLLGQIRSGIERAAASGYAEVRLHGLREEGNRQSWYGTAEVIGRQVVRSSMAHARSLGNTVARDRSCEQWADRTIRFVINAAGDTLTITASGRGAGSVHSQPTPPRSARPPSTAPKPAPVPRSRTDRPAGASRQADTDEFYAVLGELSAKLEGPRLLRDCTADSGWPRHGVYFFFEDGEVRADGSPRVVRVGTHALTETSETTLWERLRHHRGHIGGSHAGGGNHRASVFRGHVGGAIVRSGKGPVELLRSWSDRHNPGPEMAAREAAVEREVSRRIGAMPFLWLSVPERADRGFLGRLAELVRQTV